MSSDNNETKIIPSLSELTTAIKKLPTAENYDKRTYEALIDAKTGKSIQFERIKMMRSDGSKNVRWSYKGRIIIDSKHLSTNS